MHINYWCPYLTNIATIKSVIRSAKSIQKYSKKTSKEEVIILNSCGEWNFLKNNLSQIKIKNLLPFNFFNYIPKEGLIQSRLSFIIIFITNFFPLLFHVKKSKPKFLVVHLLTLLPMILSPFLSNYTKIILRVSGFPELNFFRKFIWKNFSKYIYIVTAPTKITYDILINSGIFDKKKVRLLRDPVIECREIEEKKKYELDTEIKENEFYLSIGRLTKQKNFSFLIKVFAKYVNDLKIKKLLIIGSGEEEENLQNLIKKYKMEDNILLLGFKSNVYNYINKSEAIISVAEYEDPGFVLIESAYLKKKIITSLVKNGPLEMKNHGNICYFFEYNSEEEFFKAIKESEKTNEYIILNAMKYSKKFSIFSHYRSFKKILYETLN